MRGWGLGLGILGVKKGMSGRVGRYEKSEVKV